MVTDLSVEISRELQFGEKILWSGRPRQGLALRGGDIILIPFSLVWGGFAIFWEVMAISTLGRGGGAHAPIFIRILFPLFGLPFVIIGFYLIFGRFFVDKWVRDKTIYAVTSRRVLIRMGFLSRVTKSLNVRSQPDITFSERPDGSGTITFGSTVGNEAGFDFGEVSARRGRRYAPARFEMIPDARRVYDTICKLQIEN